MIFVYWMENHESYAQQIRTIYSRMLDRGDQLCTSVFTLSELLVGPVKRDDGRLYEACKAFLTGPNVELVPYTTDTAIRFADIRAKNSVKPPDAIHLACAACSGIDLFITNDQRLRRLTIEGIRFIDGIETTALGIE
jgi:predicted nucleic acid-binding protein